MTSESSLLVELKRLRLKLGGKGQVNYITRVKFVKTCTPQRRTVLTKIKFDMTAGTWGGSSASRQERLFMYITNRNMFRQGKGTDEHGSVHEK